MIDEGEESKADKVSWQACGSKDIPKEMESAAPKQTQESDTYKEARRERIGQKEKETGT